MFWKSGPTITTPINVAPQKAHLAERHVKLQALPYFYFDIQEFLSGDLEKTPGVIFGYIWRRCSFENTSSIG